LNNGKLKVYGKFPHGMYTAHADVKNADLLAFIEAEEHARPGEPSARITKQKGR